VTVRLFFDPHRVAQLRQQGIDPQRRLPSVPAPAVKEAKAVPEQRVLIVGGAPERRVFEPGRGTGPDAEERARLRAEIDRLRRDNLRLTDENARLRGEAEHRSGPSRRALGPGQDDAAERLGLSLLELDR